MVRLCRQLDSLEGQLLQQFCSKQLCTPSAVALHAHYARHSLTPVTLGYITGTALCRCAAGRLVVVLCFSREASGCCRIVEQPAVWPLMFCTLYAGICTCDSLGVTAEDAQMLGVCLDSCTAWLRAAALTAAVEMSPRVSGCSCFLLHRACWFHTCIALLQRMFEVCNVLLCCQTAA